MMRMLGVVQLQRKNRLRLTTAQRALVKSGDEARDRKDWPSASALYQAFLAEVPTNAAIWTQLGHALKEGGHRAEGEAAYRTSLAFKPDDADVHMQLGHVLKLQGRIEEAILSYEKAQELDPAIGAEVELSHLRNYLQQPELLPSVGMDIQAAISEAQALRSAGEAKRDVGDWDGAIEDFKLLLDITPSDGGMWIQLGIAKRAVGDLVGAEQAFRLAAKLDPSNPDAPFELGNNLRRQGRLDEAEQQLRSAHALRPALDIRNELEAVLREQDALAAAEHQLDNSSDQSRAVLLQYNYALSYRRH